MARAVELARQGFPAPNPRVGCVIVREGVIVGEGFHAFAGGPHAEVSALEAAGELARGADVYVTLEPCNHYGRTGPCSEALIRAGVSTVTYAVPDPSQQARGGGERLRQAGIKVIEGVLSSAAEAVNQVFLRAVRHQRSFVTLKAATTLDGKIANDKGESKWITGPEAREQGHRLRAEMGAVLLGANTVRTDDPQLTARIEGVRNQPVRLVLDPHRSLADSYQIFREPGETIRVVSEANAHTGDIAVQILSNENIDLSDLLRKTYERGINGLLVEGGSLTLGAFLSAGLFDRLELFIAPKIMGAGLPWAGLSLENLSEMIPIEILGVQRLGSDLWISAEPKRSSQIESV